MSDDRILLSDLAFYGYHGAKAEERTLGQRFLVDLALTLDLGPAGRSDDLDVTIDYGQVYRVTREIVEGPSCHTIEAVAESLASGLLERFTRLEALTVRVKKPGAPIAGAQFGMVAVEVTRRRAAAADA